MSDTEQDGDNKRFYETRKEYAGEKDKHSNLRDKYIITLSSASLAVSVAFIEKIVPLNAAIYTGILYTAWILFALSLIVTVVTYHFSEIAYGDYIRQMDTLFSKGEEICNVIPKYAKSLTCANNVSLISYIIAICILLYFTIINVQNYNHPTSGVTSSATGNSEDAQRISTINVTIYTGGNNMTDVTIRLDKGGPKPPPPPSPPPKPEEWIRKINESSPPVTPPPPPPKKQ